MRYGTSDIILLSALLRRPDYAYHLWDRLSTTALPFSKALLYARLKHLASLNYLTRHRDGRTITYTITSAGIAHLQSELEAWNTITDAIASLCKETP